jgi:hypothetical protein
MTATETTRAVTAGPGEGDSGGLSREILVLAGVVILGTIMTVLDLTVVNVAIPTLASDLGASIPAIQWVMTGYMLAFATVIPLTGWAAASGQLDVAAFQEAWKQTLLRHTILRTSIQTENLREALQVVHSDVSPNWLVEDRRSVPFEQSAARWTDFLKQDATQPIDLSQAPMMRFALIRIAADQWKFLWSVPALLLDGWSWPTIATSPRMRSNRSALRAAKAAKSTPASSSMRWAITARKASVIVWLKAWGLPACAAMPRSAGNGAPPPAEAPSREATAHTCRVRVRPGATGADEMLAEVRRICESHPGSTPLFVHVLLAD